MKVTENTKKVIEKFQIKKVVQGRGHDMGGLICDVYFNRKKVATYLDDGWGGGARVDFTNETLKKEIEVYLTKSKFNEIMHKDGWDFMGTPKDIDFNCQFEHVVEELSVLILIQKQVKKIERACKNKIVFGTTERYSEYAWKGVKDLKDLLKYNNGLSTLQKTYDEVKKKGQPILNQESQLLELGVVL